MNENKLPDVIAGDQTERVQHPSVRVIGVGEELVIVDRLQQPLLPVRRQFHQMFPAIVDVTDASLNLLSAKVSRIHQILATLHHVQQMGLPGIQIVLHQLQQEMQEKCQMILFVDCLNQRPIQWLFHPPIHLLIDLHKILLKSQYPQPS